ncbi:MAG: DUF2846 domain-containing protein [Verrucomicrobia bacterium]|nr:DUF2846 domain-containing protein [Verrucomicrobiota bacterium]
MKIHPALLTAFLGAALFGGCATGPSFESYSATLAPVKETEGRIWFYRPSKMFGAAVQPAVRLNEEKIGKAQPGSFFYADRPPGGYEVKCTTEWSDKCQLSLAAKDTKYIRLGMMVGVFVGHVIPKEVDEATALKELKKCKHITAEDGKAEK